MIVRLAVMLGAALLMTPLPQTSSAAETAAPAYKLAGTIPLGAGERWDYATFDQGRIYVAHGDHVTVVNAATGAVAGQIGPLPGGTQPLTDTLDIDA